MSRRLFHESIKRTISHVADPPSEFGLVMWWGWGGPVTRDSVRSSLDTLRSKGITVVLLGAGYDIEPRYLSDGWFEMIAFTVEELKKRGMLLWIADEGSYPSGFAGGIFNDEFPDLRMKALLVKETIAAKGRGPLEIATGPNTLGLLAVERSTGRSHAIEPNNGKTVWEAPSGDWEVRVIGWDYRTSPTRYVHHPQKIKDTTYSLCDYLDPAAVTEFMNATHEKYKKAIGREFGRTILGFFGDEPGYGFIPWTRRLPEEFMRKKGYDLSSYLPLLFQPVPDETSVRFKADYWDVWSDMFRDNFVKPQADWCEENNIQYVMHLNHEDMMRQLAESEGDYFKGMRYVHVPAVDVIWRQIWTDKRANFPKLASSTARLFGRKRTFSETFAIYGRGLSLAQAKWVIDFLLVRGINTVMTAFYSLNPSAHEGWPACSPQWDHFDKLAGYTRRMSCLLSQGRPCADVGLYFPTYGYWLAGEETDASLWHICRCLMENQVDFDFIDEQILQSGGETFPGGNFRTVLVPPAAVMSAKAFGKLNAFVSTGGEVLCVDKRPVLVVAENFMNARKPDCCDWPVTTIDAVTSRGMEFSVRRPGISCFRRNFDDGEIHLFFNENDERTETPVDFSRGGRVYEYDIEMNAVYRIPCTQTPEKKSRINLFLGGHETKIIFMTTEDIESVTRPNLKEIEISTLDGEWRLDIDGKIVDTELKKWSELGFGEYSGKAVYTKNFMFEIGQEQPGNRYFLECGSVLYSARLFLNGKDLDVKAWRPFRWDVTGILKNGENALRFEVFNSAAAAYAGSPEKKERLEKEASKGGYLAFTVPMDLQMVESGLFEVSIVVFGPL